MTVPTGDSRPAPRYGEYATPEEQRARIQQPAEVPAPQPLPSGPVTPTTAMPTAAAARPTRLADRIISLALLAYGLVTVLGAVPQLADFPAFARTWMEMAGVDGTFTNVEQGVLWGRIGAVVLVGGWMLTAVLSWLSLRARRITWWIPLVGAIVTFMVVTALMIVPLLGDAAVVEHFGL